jgi:hypothetical protein
MKGYKLWILASVLPFVSTSSPAVTDYQCLNDCTAAGYMYQLCQSRCSYEPSPNYGEPSSNRTDYQCLNDCTAKGHQYAYCKQACAY